MSSPTNHTTGQWTWWVSTACGGIALFVGVLVLAGWLFQVPALKSVLPGLISMKPNTALAFVLAGLALVLGSGTPVAPHLPAPQNKLSRQPGRARAGQWLALLVVLIGGLTLGEYLFGWHLGIDELLFKDDPNAAATLIPGRMAPSTAVCFVLLGLASVGVEWEPRRGFRPAEVSALVVALVGLSSLAEYAVGQPILYGFSQYSRMALHTAAVFVVLAAGVLLARPAQGMVSALRSGRITPWERMFYVVLSLALPIVLIGGGWFYHAQEEQVRRAVEAELETIARLKAQQVVQWRAERLADAAVLMDNQFFAESVARWLANPQVETGDKVLAWFRAMHEYDGYDDVLLVDRRGQVRLSVSDRPSAFHVDTVQAVAAAFRTRRPVLTGLHRPPGDPTAHLEAIAPLFAANETTNEPIGAVILRQEARQFLYPLIQSWPTASRSAETLLVRREGDSVLFLNELRYRQDTALKLLIPLTQREVPAVMAALGKEGVFHGSDYRGVKVLSVLKHIPDTSWAIVAKMDEAEAFAEWRFRANLIVAVVVLLTLAQAAAARMILQQRKTTRTLSQSVEALLHARAIAEAANLELSEQGEELARSNKELEQFAYVASHDLQEPLRMVSSYTELLGRRYKGKLDADADEFIAFAVEGATRMQTMINDLLAYSRLGRTEWSAGPVDCHSVLARALANLSFAIEESHALVTSDPLPTVPANEAELTQLLQNLIANAIKFRSEQPPVVHVSARRSGADWVFAVRDNGIGIAPEHCERIFVIFQRLNARDRYSGTGIGLAICKKIVEHHRGRIWVESEPGGGSTFFFTIPETEKATP